MINLMLKLEDLGAFDPDTLNHAILHFVNLLSLV